MKNCTIKNEYYTIVVSARGAELISVKDSLGYEYLWQGGEGFWESHAPILFPVCGSLLDKKYTYDGKEYPMNAHGFARKSEFAVARKEGGHITMTLSSNEESRKIYPFDFTLIANYELRGREIIFSLTVTNKTATEMPYMFGWHPGFNLPCGKGIDIESYKLDFGVDKLMWYPLQNGPFVTAEGKPYPTMDGSYQLCEEEIYKNDTMIFTGHNNSVKMFADGCPYRLEFEWSENLPYFCVWKDEFNEAKFVCLEPWSDVPRDGVTPENFNNRNMRRLASGESETFTYKLRFSSPNEPCV